jgi:hypothetical protein
MQKHARSKMGSSPLLRAAFRQCTTAGFLTHRWSGRAPVIQSTSIKMKAPLARIWNGNYISINNNSQGDILTITDTLGRIINFHYDPNANLDYIWQNWNGAPHYWVTFGWGDSLTINASWAYDKPQQ